jgi:phenylacetate-coenzyme A ligase PaaK-like adenylate-forming protein
MSNITESKTEQIREFPYHYSAVLNKQNEELQVRVKTLKWCLSEHIEARKVFLAEIESLKNEIKQLKN